MVRLTLFTWLLCCFVGTLLLYIGYMITVGAGDHYRSVESSRVIAFAGGVALAVSLIASIPAMVGFGLIAAKVLRKSGVGQARFITSVYAVLATLATFFIIAACFFGVMEDSDAFSSVALFALPYIISFVLAICVLKWPGQRKPVALWADDELNTWGGEKPGEPLPALFPLNVFYAVIGLMVLGLLLSGSQWAGTLFTLRGAMRPQVMWVVGVALFIAGLVIFSLRRSVGWALVTVLSTSNIAVLTYGVVSQLDVLIRYRLHSFLLSTAAYLAIDIAKLILLMRPSLRRAFRISNEQAWLWALAGIGYAAVQVLLFRYVSW